MTPKQIALQWKAGFTDRWHSHAELGPYPDPIVGHSGRVALLMLGFWDDTTREALIAALRHDLAEYKVGDVSGKAKREYHDFKKALDEVEAQVFIEMFGLKPSPLPMPWSQRLNMCDKLDPLLFAQLHRPDLMMREDWIASRAKVLDMAGEMGIHHEVSEVIRYAA